MQLKGHLAGSRGAERRLGGSVPYGSGSLGIRPGSARDSVGIARDSLVMRAATGEGEGEPSNKAIPQPDDPMAIRGRWILSRHHETKKLLSFFTLFFSFFLS